jgi:hypothetical protein
MAQIVRTGGWSELVIEAGCVYSFPSLSCLEAVGLGPRRWSILDDVVSLTEESWGGVNKQTYPMLLVQNALQAPKLL